MGRLDDMPGHTFNSGHMEQSRPRQSSSSKSWSPGEHTPDWEWARRHETTNSNPPTRPGRGDGLLGDTPIMPPRHAILPRPPSLRSQQHHFNRSTASSSIRPNQAGPERRKWSVWVDYPSRVVNCEEMELESAQKTDIDSIEDFDALVPAQHSSCFAEHDLS